MAHLIVKVRDRPGSLSLLTDLVAEMGANVLDIHHRRGFADISVGDVEIVLDRLAPNVRYDVLLISDEPSFYPRDGRIRQR